MTDRYEAREREPFPGRKMILHGVYDMHAKAWVQNEAHSSKAIAEDAARRLSAAYRRAMVDKE